MREGTSGSMNPSLRTSAVSLNRTDVLMERSVETSHPSLAVALMEQLNPTASTPPRTEDDPTRSLNNQKRDRDRPETRTARCPL